MAEAAAAGVSTERFWTITPRELRAEFKASGKRYRLAAKLALFTAWQTGAFMPRRKRMPPLKPMLDRLEPQRRMTNRELRNVLLSWHKQADGTTRVVPLETFRSL